VGSLLSGALHGKEPHQAYLTQHATLHMDLRSESKDGLHTNAPMRTLKDTYAVYTNLRSLSFQLTIRLIDYAYCSSHVL